MGGMIKQHLEMITTATKLCNALLKRPYSSIEHFILEEGEQFESPQKSMPLRWRGEPKMCYSNSLDLVLGYPLACPLAEGAVYCEGYAYPEGLIPMAHAWLESKDGDILETTWDTPAAEYYGVRFDLEFVKETVLRKGEYGVIDDWKNGWPLLCGMDSALWRYSKETEGVTCKSQGL